jgi:16S rRNA (uracil1498-N3)-methyltransferase
VRRYWISKEDLNGDTVQFKGDVFHHIFDVCRQQKSSKFEVLTEDGNAYLVEVTEVQKKSAAAHVLEVRQIPPLKEPHIHLALAISRFPVMDAIVEKAVELGVKSIQCFFSEYSFLRSDEKLSQNKMDRWEKIIKSATQQSGRGDLMKLHAPIHLKELPQKINRAQGQVGLFAYEGSTTLSIKSFVEQIKTTNKAPKEIWIIVGSEGGFSQDEVQFLANLDLHPVSLGPQVLRVETACMALVSVLKYDFGLMS